MGDGAVKFVTDSIDASNSSSTIVYYFDNANQNMVGRGSPFGVWGALGTRASREVISEEL